MEKYFLNLNQSKLNFENHPSEMNDTREILKFLIALDRPSYLRTVDMFEKEILNGKVILMEK